MAVLSNQFRTSFRTSFGETPTTLRLESVDLYPEVYVILDNGALMEGTPK